MIKDLEVFSFFAGRPCNNISKEEYDKAEYLILGHFTTSKFLDSILTNGIKAPVETNNYSNRDMFIEGDKYYIYLTSHFDSVFARNAVAKFCGHEILILVKVKKDTLECDNLENYYTNKGISLNCQNEIYKALVQGKGLSYQCRTKVKIPPEQIIEVLDVEEVSKNRLLPNESYSERAPLPLSKLREKVNIKLLRY